MSGARGEPLFAILGDCRAAGITSEGVHCSFAPSAAALVDLLDEPAPADARAAQAETARPAPAQQQQQQLTPPQGSMDWLQLAHSHGLHEEQTFAAPPVLLNESRVAAVPQPAASPGEVSVALAAMAASGGSVIMLAAL